MTDSDTALLAGQTWQELLARRSFIELDALGRADGATGSRLAAGARGALRPARIPWLEPQGITPQADDGTVIARGTVDGRPVVIAAIEQGFQGGGTGEVSGAKISQALLLAAADSRAGTPTAASSSSRPVAYGCRRPTWASTPSPRSAPPCWICARLLR